MRISQDLCIALVLTVIGAGLAKPPAARGADNDGFSVVEDTIAGRGLSAAEATSVRNLIAQARERELAGDEDGAASAMAEASALLRIS